MWSGIVGVPMDIPKVKEFIESLYFHKWRPSLIVWHNTAAPTLEQWRKSAEEDRRADRAPGITRTMILQHYFSVQRGWPSGPHAFVADDVIWPFTPFNMKGTHSPSWNGIAIGIEMIGDFSREDDDTGVGLRVKQNTIALTAILCGKLGLDPMTAIKLHKEDKHTDHDCPGIDIARDKDAMIQAVLEYMGHAGEHVDPVDAPPPRMGVVAVAHGDTLNMRETSSASSAIMAKLLPAAELQILDEGQNGATKWLFVQNKVGQRGWVAARYVQER